MHEPTQRRLLDKYHDKFRTRQFQSGDLGGEFWRPFYSTKIYDGCVAKIDRLLGSDLCLQLHYYYSLVQRLNTKSAEDDSQVNYNYAMSYLSLSADAYTFGNGSVRCLLGNSEAKKSIQDNLMSLVDTFHNKDIWESVSGILSAYEKNGFATHPPRRLHHLLWRLKQLL